MAQVGDLVFLSSIVNLVFLRPPSANLLNEFSYPFHRPFYCLQSDFVKNLSAIMHARNFPDGSIK